MNDVVTLAVAAVTGMRKYPRLPHLSEDKYVWLCHYPH